MTEQKEQSLNTQSVLSMRGAGYYSQRTAGAKDAIDSLRPLIDTAIDQLADMPVLRFADFGPANRWLTSLACFLLIGHGCLGSAT